MAQEVFLQVYRALPQFTLHNFKAWIGKIATRKAIDWKRSHACYDRDLYDIDLNSIKDNNFTAPDELLINEENRQEIRNISKNLAPRYARVINTYYFENKSYQQIARDEGISIKTVESRLYRARSLIRQKWKEGSG